MTGRRRVAVVAGGGHGLGATVARDLAAAGLHVVIVDRDPAAAAEVGAGLAGCEVGVCDPADGAAVASLLDDVVAKHHRLDLFVVSADWADRIASHVATTADWRAALAVDLDAVHECLEHAVHAMSATGGGTVVTIAPCASGSDHMRAGYRIAAQAAAVSLTLAVAADARPTDVRVHAVCPGWRPRHLFDAVRFQLADLVGLDLDVLASPALGIVDLGTTTAGVGPLVARLGSGTSRATGGAYVLADELIVAG